MKASLTIDMEHDCPPFLKSYRGMEEGAPLFLELLDRAEVTATFFCTGDVARRFPETMRQIVAGGHELSCHGDTHRRFSTMTEEEARREIADSSAVLRSFGDVTGFRAPNLDFPDAFLPLLADHGYSLDSSLAAYKPHKGHPRRPLTQHGLLRIPTSTMPSVVRLPRLLSRPLLRMLREPVVLFFHPWEFVDMTRAAIPRDCRFSTGRPALDALQDAIDGLRARGAEFLTMRQLGERLRDGAAG